MSKNPDESDFQKVSAERLADMIEMNPSSASYVITKFKKLFNGARGDVKEDYLSRKAIAYFDKFQKMPIQEVFSYAEEVVNPEADTTRSEEYLAKRKGYTEKSAANKVAKEKMKNTMMIDVANTYVQYKPLGEERAAKQTLKAIAAKYSISQEELISAIKNEMKEPAIKRIFLNVAK